MGESIRGKRPAAGTSLKQRRATSLDAHRDIHIAAKPCSLWQALPLYERALQGREQKLGAMHPETLRSVNNLAMVLKAMGKHEEALPLYQRALQ